MNLQELHKEYLEHKTIKDCDALAAVKQDGFALRLVQNQTDEICLAAVKRDGGALLYVNPAIFKNMTQDLTVEEVSEKLGYNVRIIK